ncbi:MAG: hypothetical protein RLY31_1407 [Bacteroidota bacterium]|jgi:acetyl esterase/lipase
MRKSVFLFVAMLCLLSGVWAQEVISLASVPAPEGVSWPNGERLYFSDIWQTEVLTNVSEPSLTVYRPAPGTANGTALVIAPGGGFHALSIVNEGEAVARWCAERGITAFLLKYRLVPTGEDGVQEFMDRMNQPERRSDGSMAPLIGLAKADGRAAVAHVRAHAATWGIDPARIGIMGFSAGGSVAGAAVFEHRSEAERPDFAAPIYPALMVVGTDSLPAAPMPLFMAVTGDDVFGFQTQCVDLYKRWNAAGLPVELHVYDRGGHGFGMRRQGLPSDDWIAAFGRWMQSLGLLPPQ